MTDKYPCNGRYTYGGSEDGHAPEKYFVHGLVVLVVVLTVFLAVNRRKKAPKKGQLDHRLCIVKK